MVAPGMHETQVGGRTKHSLKLSPSRKPRIGATRSRPEGLWFLMTRPMLVPQQGHVPPIRQLHTVHLISGHRSQNIKKKIVTIG